MKIEFIEQDNTFHIQNDRISYVIGLEHGKYLKHCYFGRKLRAYGGSGRQLLYNRAFAATPEPEDVTFSLDTLLQEYPWTGQGDFRSPALEIMTGDGDGVIRPVYEGFRIFDGKPALAGLPSLYVEEESEAKTLELILWEERLQARLHLFYTIYRDHDVVARHAVLENCGAEPFSIERMLSFSMDLPEDDYEVLTLGGSHAHEKNMYRRPVCADAIVTASRRGTSSPQASPFIGLLRSSTTEESGEAIGISLVYSGNFRGSVEVDQYRTLRVQLGINPEGFGWKLAPGEAFTTPEAVMVCSTEGIGGMSRIYHEVFRKRLVRGVYRDQPRPVLLNSWEAMYFDISEEKLLSLAREAKELGIELLVMDDGWFKGRNTETTSLGDWTPDPVKFPSGLDGMIDRICDIGLRFGIWFEPEMISEESSLYREHPDWVIRSSCYRPVESRYQWVLDLSNPRVCEYLVDAVSGILKNRKITYVKWDMNRHLTDPGSLYLGRERQKELSHRYVLGLYQVLEELTGRFPEVLFESCSSGGGRFDAGMLYYMPQTWTSDNTDAVCRLGIQYGTSIQFPAVTMGAHVSASPNHQVGRETPLSTRFHVAMSGNLGYELDVTALSEEERKALAEQTACYRELRETIQFGSFYRIRNPFEGNDAAWSIVSEDGKTVVLMYFRVLSKPAYAVPVIRLCGLDQNGSYRSRNDGRVYGGDELMYAGVSIPREKKDFGSMLMIYDKLQETECQEDKCNGERTEV
ncbi:MAG: alpha-galactosidase [Clostridiales bacterium]|nr:alpha-galactosidase [Clostridiales bacterium]